MKKLLILLVVIINFQVSESYAQSNNSDDIIGEWYTEENKSIVEIFKKDQKYYGKIIWIEEPNDEDGKPKKDKENPIPAFRERPILGMVFMFGFEYEGKNVWSDGKVYDPESGNTYSGKLTLDDINTLKARGYIGFSAIGRNTTWIRKTG